MVSNCTEPSACSFVHSALVLSQEEVLRILPEQLDPEAVPSQALPVTHPDSRDSDLHENHSQEHL